jgi:hypothetical protein
LATIADLIAGVSVGEMPVGEAPGAAQLETTPATSAAVTTAVTVERRLYTIPLQ